MSCQNKKAWLVALEVKPSIFEEIKAGQANNNECERTKQGIKKSNSPVFLVHDDGTLRFQNRLCVPEQERKRRRMLEKAHNTIYSAHLRGIKMYNNLKKHFRLPNMKREVAEYVDRSLMCQKIKVKTSTPCS